MLAAHRVVGTLVLVATALAALWGLISYRRGGPPTGVLQHLLALAQTLLVGQVGLGLLLLSDHRRAGDRLHYIYGTLALATILSPWLYAPVGPRRRLLWFGGATLVAALLAGRAYMTAS